MLQIKGINLCSEEQIYRIKIEGVKMEYPQSKEDTKVVLINLEALAKSKDKQDDKVPHLSLQVKKALGLVGY